MPQVATDSSKKMVMPAYEKVKAAMAVNSGFKCCLCISSSKLVLATANDKARAVLNLAGGVTSHRSSEAKYLPTAYINLVNRVFLLYGFWGYFEILFDFLHFLFDLE